MTIHSRSLDSKRHGHYPRHQGQKKEQLKVMMLMRYGCVPRTMGWDATLVATIRDARMDATNIYIRSYEAQEYKHIANFVICVNSGFSIASEKW